MRKRETGVSTGITTLPQAVLIADDRGAAKISTLCAELTMNANAVAESPPAISKTTPRSHVVSETTNQLCSYYLYEAQVELRFDTVSSDRLTKHGRKDDKRSDNQMSSLRKRLVLEECLFDDFSADVVFQWDCLSALERDIIPGENEQSHHQTVRCLSDE